MVNIKRYFGNKQFYKSVLAISVPIMIQSGITNLVNMLDNIMVGSLGTEAISSVAIANTFIQVFNYIIYGASAATGIFSAQYHGAGDTPNVRNIFRIKLMINVSIASLTILILSLFGKPLISIFLNSNNSEGDIAKTLLLSKEYLTIILVGLIPHSISQAYASALRETKNVKLPAFSSIVTVSTNFVLNLLLIYGLLGLPAMGIAGAALATTISRFVEIAILTISVHTRSHKFQFIIGAYRSFKVPAKLVMKVVKKGLPFLANEALCALALTLNKHCYSTQGLDAIAAMNIQSTVSSVLVITFSALSNAIGIMVGNLLGAGKKEEAIDTNSKLLMFAFLVGAVVGVFQIAISPLFPLLYNTSDSVRSLASYMMIISGLTLPASSLAVSCYFTLRSGGRALLTMLFDCVYGIIFTVPIGYLFAFGFNSGIHALFAAVTITEASKGILGLILVMKVNWAQKLTV